MFKKLRILLWGIALEIENWLYPYESNPEEDYYIKVKNDETGEQFFVMDWIKCHNEKIENLQDEMVWIKYEINDLKNKLKDKL